MNFESIRSQANAEWELLNQKTRILIGTATCGRAAGSGPVAKAFEAELKRQNADAPVNWVGCMGLCYAEPLVVILKPGNFNVCYGKVTPDLVPRLVEGYVLGDDPQLDLALGTFEVADGQAPVIPELSRLSTRCG